MSLESLADQHISQQFEIPEGKRRPTTRRLLGHTFAAAALDLVDLAVNTTKLASTVAQRGLVRSETALQNGLRRGGNVLQKITGHPGR